MSGPGEMLDKHLAVRPNYLKSVGNPKTSQVISAFYKDGEIYLGISGGKILRNNHPVVQGALDTMPKLSRTPFIGGCSEVDIANQLAELGKDPRGGFMRSMSIRPDTFGQPKPPCKSCHAMLRRLGVHF